MGRRVARAASVPGQTGRTLSDLLHSHRTGGVLTSGVWAVLSDEEVWDRR